jgi:hypothetical protein
MYMGTNHEGSVPTIYAMSPGYDDYRWRLERTR